MANSRREFLSAAAGLVGSTMLVADQPPSQPLPRGRAEACIFIWLGGGCCHVDTWDPKNRGNSERRQAGSDYDAIPTAVEGVRVTEHLRRSADLLDRMAIVRTVHHDLQEHASAVNRMHTGRLTSGTILYPSIGSIVAHERGAADDDVPAYVVIGYPNVTRGPGFLGSRYGYVYLTDTDAGPNGLTRPQGIDAARQQRREQLLARTREMQMQRRPGDRALEEYAAVSQQGFRLAGPEFMRVFNLQNEPADRRTRFGSEFGQRCLLARRLVESGVRFVEVSFNLNFVNGTGWDTHNDGQQNQHLLIQDLDQALSALVLDLERSRMLDRTLVVVSTEFGRPPEFDAGGGRGHQPEAFSVVLAGGGLRTGRAVGQTDDAGKRIAERPVSVPDLFATIHWALGINPRKELHTPDNRPVPITDNGRVITELFA